MSKIVKISISLILASVLVIGILIYVVSEKINPEEIKKLVVKGVTDALPATSVHLEKVDYTIGPSITIALRNFDLRLRDSKTKLFNVADVEVKVPIWAILTGGGAIDVTIKGPNAYYVALNKTQYNWDKAVPESGNSKEENKEESSKEDKVFKVPAFINNSRIDIKITDLNLEYTPYQAKQSIINVSKILFKNINLKSSTAFEITSDIQYAIDPVKNFKTNLQLIGEVNIGKFLKEKTLSTTMLTNLVDTSITGLDFQIPDMENKLSLEIKPDGTIVTESDFKAGSVAEAVIHATLSDEKLNVSKLQLNAYLSKIPDILPNELRDSLQTLNLSKSNLNLRGDLDLGLEPMTLNPNLVFEIKNPVGLQLNNSINVATTMKGTFKGKQLSLKLVSEMLSGSVTTAINTEVNPLSLPEKLSNFPLTKIDVVATNIKLSREFLQNTLYGGKKEEDKASAQGAVTEQVAGELIELPPVDLVLEGKNIFIDKEELNFNSMIKVRGNKIFSDKFLIVYSKGNTNINFNTILQDTKNIKNDFNIFLKNMNLSALNSLLPPFISKISGIYEGNIKGDLNLLADGMNYDIKAKISALNGDLDDLNVKKLVTAFFESLKDKIPKQYETVSNKFDKINIDVRATTKKIDVNNFVMIGDKKSIEISLKGDVSMIDKKSTLSGDIMLEETRAQLEKEFGIKKWPVKFSGNGFVMMPDLGYTTGKLADIKLKAAGKSAQQAAKKSLEKEKKKAQKKLEDKARELIKGIKI